MKFEITSKIYYWFVLLAVIAVLLMDGVNSISFFLGRVTVPAGAVAMIIFGMVIRLGILIMLFALKGPIKVFIYLWGAMFILSGFAGVSAMLLRGVEIDYFYLGEKLIFLTVGLLLVVPVHRVVKNA